MMDETPRELILAAFFAGRLSGAFKKGSVLKSERKKPSAHKKETCDLSQASPPYLFR